MLTKLTRATKGREKFLRSITFFKKWHTLQRVYFAQQLTTETECKREIEYLAWHVFPSVQKTITKECAQAYSRIFFCYFSQKYTTHSHTPSLSSKLAKRQGLSNNNRSAKCINNIDYQRALKMTFLFNCTNGLYAGEI